jgi:hypothetical protein
VCAPLEKRPNFHTKNKESCFFLLGFYLGKKEQEDPPLWLLELINTHTTTAAIK